MDDDIWICMISNTLINWPVVAHDTILPPHHIAFPRHSDQLAGGDAGELQGEGGVVVTSPIKPLKGCHKLQREIGFAISRVQLKNPEVAKQISEASLNKSEVGFR